MAPRAFAKTTLKCFLIPIYQALNEPDEFRHYLNIQATSTKAVAVNLSIRSELETNELLHRDYGDMCGTDKWTEKQFVLKNEVIFSAIGAGDSVRGVHYQNIRPDYIMIDDLYDDDDRNNIHRIERKGNWFWSSIYKVRAKGRKTCIHIQGTAMHRQDLLHKQAKSKSWKFRKFQAITDMDKQEVLWPEVEPFESLLKDRADMGISIFEREMQNNCRDDESSIIKESWIQYYQGVVPGDEKIIKKIGGCDPAIGEKATNDFTGKVLTLKTNLENYYIHEIKQDRMSFYDNEQDIINWHSRINFDIFRGEGIAAFQGFFKELRRKSKVPLDLITYVKDKITRLENQESKFQNKKVFINMNIPDKLRNELVYQLINNEPEHDDLRDALLLTLEDASSPLYIGVI